MTGIIDTFDQVLIIWRRVILSLILLVEAHLEVIGQAIRDDERFLRQFLISSSQLVDAASRGLALGPGAGASTPSRRLFIPLQFYLMSQLLERIFLLHRQLIPSLFGSLSERLGAQLGVLQVEAPSEFDGEELEGGLGRLAIVRQAVTIFAIKLFIVLLLLIVFLVLEAWLAFILMISFIFIRKLVRLEGELRFGSQALLTRLTDLTSMEVWAAGRQTASHD